MTNIEFLQNVEVFKGLNNGQLALLQEHFREENYRLGDKLFNEGDSATRLWLMKEGQVDLRFDLPGRDTSDANTISSLNQYNAFGWSCFVPPNKYRLSAYCVTGTAEVLTIEQEKMTRVFESNPDLGYRFMLYLVRVVGTRFDEFQDEVARHRGEDIISGW
jgi:CRP-like cAMP-binding protein